MSNRDGLAVLGVATGLVVLAWAPGTAAAVLGAGLFLAGAMLRPRGGLAGVIAGLPFYLVPRQLGGLQLSPPEVGVLLCTLATGAHAVADRRRPEIDAPLLRASRFDAPIALLLGAALASLLVTEYLRLSLRELRTLVVEPVLFFYLLRRLVRSTDDAAQLVDVLLGATTIVALLAIGQFALGGPGVTEVQGVRRVQGTYSSPNHLALLLGRAIPFLLAGAWLGLQRWPRLAAGVELLLALGLTFSLGGWLATTAALLTLLGLLGGRRRVALGMAAAAVLVLVLVATPLLPIERIAGRLDPSSGTTLVRVQLWAAAAQMLAGQPLLGIGLDTFLYRYPAYLEAGIAVEPNLSHPHNLVLQFWLQLGLAGLVALAWLLILFVRAVWGTARAGPPRDRALAAGALASMVNFVVHGAIDNSYFLVDMAFIFWLTLAVGHRLLLWSEPRSVSS